MAKEKTKNSIIRNFGRQILTGKLYWALFALFILLFFFGQNIPANGDTNLSSQNDINPEIASGGTAYTLSSALDSRKGDVYHLLFQTKVQLIAADGSSPTGNTVPAQEKIQLNLTDDLGNMTTVSSINVPINSDSFTSNDLTFTADGLYQNLILQKTDPDSQSEIFIKDIHLVRLEGSNPIKPSFVGAFYESTQVENFDALNANKYIILDKKNITVGQTFTAQSDYLTGVTLKLHFRGNGGNGEYHLAVREVTNGKVSDNDLAELDFNNPASDTLYQIGAGVYRFPISAKLTQGKEYLISIDNKNVQANFLNALEVCKTNNSALDSNGQLVSVNQKDEIENGTGDVYVKYDFADQPTYNGERANFGDTFDDLGNGAGDYNYNKNNLDIFEFKNDSVVYKIDTFYPFKMLYSMIGLNTVQFNNDYHFYYSFDDKNWQEIFETEQAKGTGQFEGQIKGDGKKEIVYFKATGVVFGSRSVDLNSLTIHATVNTNN